GCSTEAFRAETEKRESKRTEEMKQRNIMPGVEVLIAKQWERIYAHLNISTAFFIVLCISSGE
ncbi:hypothetical protein N5J70_06725, partial [Pseudomonas sp. GD03909]|nr:hypothetical protein [Pseudomonas sp. GD03909]